MVSAMIVWDRHPERARELAGSGAQISETVPEAVTNAGIVVTMVPDAEAVVSLAVDNGMLDAMATGAIWAQMSTIGVDGIERVASIVRDRRPDIHLLDAPVAGSKEPAEQGELTIFASGPAELRQRVARLFDALGQRTVWVGSVGAGSRMNLVNNTLLAFTNEGLAAAVALAYRLGIDTTTVIDAIGTGPLISPWAAAKLGRIAKDDYSSQFALTMALKDVTSRSPL